MDISKIGSKIPSQRLVEFQNRNAIIEVLGCLMNDPQLLKTYKLELYDVVDIFHQTILGVIKNLAREGARSIEVDTVEDYLKAKYPLKYERFKKNDGERYLKDAKEFASLENFVANYDEVRKWSVLRQLMQNGIDVSEYYDPDEIDSTIIEKKSDAFSNASIEEIIGAYKTKVIRIDSMFNCFGDRESIRAGGQEAMAQKESWKKTIKHGLSYASNYQTTVTYGIQRGKFTVISAGTGCGKSRMSVATIAHTFAPKFWDESTGEWVDNPNGTNNSCLYIGTEMKLREEVEPILWAYMANVPEDHIILNRYEAGEEERVDEAIRILSSETENRGIYMEYIPNYDIATLEEVIRFHVDQHHITSVWLDYIHTTTALVAEYQRSTGGKMAIREDQVLGNLSAKLKEFTSTFNISIDSWTQVTGNFKDESNRDQTIVRGSKAIIDKTDVAGILSRPTQSELEKLKNILRNKMIGNSKKPNVCMSVYKNRGGKFNEIKIWLYVDYGTMRVHDLFVTGYDYIILPINKTTVKIDEDGQPKPIEYKDSYKLYLERLAEEAKEYEKNYPDSDLAKTNDNEILEGDTLEEVEKRLEAHAKSTAGSSLIDEVDRQIKYEIMENGPAYEGNPFINLDNMDDIDYPDFDSYDPYENQMV